jgi:hypothetical protein
LLNIVKLKIQTEIAIFDPDLNSLFVLSASPQPLSQKREAKMLIQRFLLPFSPGEKGAGR